MAEFGRRGRIEAPKQVPAYDFEREIPKYERVQEHSQVIKDLLVRIENIRNFRGNNGVRDDERALSKLYEEIEAAYQDYQK